MSRTIEEAEKLAKRILTHKIRKTLGGVLHFFWSTYIVVVGILYSIPQLRSITSYLLIPLVLIYIVYTSVLFHKAYTKREFLNSSKNKLRYVIFSVFLVTIIGIWMYSLILFNDFSYYVISIAMYVSIVSFQIYNIARETGKVRYYDHIAVISFVLSMLLGPFNYLMYYVYFFPWIYAGVKSIIESYEGTDDE